MTGKTRYVLRLPAILLAILIVAVWLQPAFAATISLSGTIYDTNSAPVPGATVQQVGKASVTTTTASDGTFTLTGLPSAAPFQVQIAKTGYEKIYSMYIEMSTNITNASWVLLPANFGTSVGNTAGLGVIAGKVFDSGNNSEGISGATVTAMNQASQSLLVLYTNSSLSTLIDGKFLVLNVTPTDTITLTATKAGISFPQTVCVGYSDGATEPGLFGSPTTGTVWSTSLVVDAVSGTPVARRHRPAPLRSHEHDNDQLGRELHPRRHPGEYTRGDEGDAGQLSPQLCCSAFTG